MLCSSGYVVVCLWWVGVVQMYGGALLQGQGVGVDLVACFGEVHEQVFQALIRLPGLAGLSLDFSQGGDAYRTMLEAHG